MRTAATFAELPQMFAVMIVIVVATTNLRFKGERLAFMR